MTLGYEWYDTPNIHLCTLADFKDLCHKLNITIERFIPCHRDGQAMTMSLARLPIFANLLADQAVFVLHQNAEPIS